MPYSDKTWKYGDEVTPSAMNAIEQGIKNATNTADTNKADIALINTNISTMQTDINNKYTEVRGNIDNLESAIGNTINLLNPTLRDIVVNGITVHYENGTYTLNGTATNSDQWELPLCTISVEKGKSYKLIGYKNPTADAFLKADVSNFANYLDNGIFIAKENYESIYIKFVEGASFNNEVIRPMLTPNLSATYDDFVSFTGSTGKLNSDVAEIRNDINAKNQIISNDDGSGKTVNTTDWVYLGTHITIPSGKTALVVAQRFWNSGKPIGVLISESPTDCTGYNAIAVDDRTNTQFQGLCECMRFLNTNGSSDYTAYLWSKAETGVSVERMYAILF